MPKTVKTLRLLAPLVALATLFALASCDSDPPARSTVAKAEPAAAVTPPVVTPSGSEEASSDASGSEAVVPPPEASASGSEVVPEETTASGSEDLTVVVTEDDPEKDFKANEFTDEMAIDYLKQSCGGCHKTGAGNDSAWSMGTLATFSVTSFGADPFASLVYSTIGNKFLGHKEGEASPEPMPFGREMDLDMKKDLAGVLLWMRVKFEVAAADGEERLGGALNLQGPKVSTKYKCANPPTRAQFMRRVFGDLFDRDPSLGDQAQFYKPGDAAEIATAEFRTKVLDEIFKPGSLLNKDFRNKALPKFAAKVSGSNGLLANGDEITAEMLPDLKKEFYQLLLKYVETMSFKDLMLAKKVLVTKKTAKLYGAECETLANASTELWVECALSNTRSNFFGTRGYLSLWKSSFLQNNNNYTRMAHMYTVLSGEALKPKTDGPTGGEAAANPALACLKSKDNRGRLSDPNDPNSALLKNGTLAIPNVGAYCQSCHIGRNLANGSIVFRKFGLHGEILTKDAINEVNLIGAPPTPKPKYYDQVKEAADSGRVFVDSDVAGSRTVAAVKDNINRLANLLDSTEDENHGCVVNTVDGQQVQKPILNLADLVSEIIGDGKILVQGLGRHIPRAFGNQSLTNQEILSTLKKAYADGEGKLYPMFAAYLKTESYSCLRNADAAD